MPNDSTSTSSGTTQNTRYGDRMPKNAIGSVRRDSSEKPIDRSNSAPPQLKKYAVA